jgi:hypothetical protein
VAQPKHARAGPPQVVGIARGGLQRRGHAEEGFLQPLEVIADTGLTQVTPPARLPSLVLAPSVRKGCFHWRPPCLVDVRQAATVWSPCMSYPNRLSYSATCRPVRTFVRPAQADHLLELYETKWQRSVDPLYNEFMY